MGSPRAYRLQGLYQLLQNGSGHEERIAIWVYVIIRDATPSQRAHQDWHQAAFHGAISSGQHYGCSFDTDGDRLDSHAIIAKEEDTVVCSRL